MIGFLGHRVKLRFEAPLEVPIHRTDSPEYQASTPEPIAGCARTECARCGDRSDS